MRADRLVIRGRRNAPTTRLPKQGDALTLRPGITAVNQQICAKCFTNLRLRSDVSRRTRGPQAVERERSAAEPRFRFDQA